MEPKCYLKACGLRWCAVLSMLGVLNTNAAMLLVTNTADSGPGSLRAALLEANLNSPARIEVVAQGNLTLSAALPAITTDLTIVGPGAAALRLSGGQAFPLLSVAEQGSLRVQQLTLADGLGAAGGGALRNLGAVVLQACVLSNNIGTNMGGAILNYGTLVLDGCTLVSNRVYGSPGQALVSTNTAETGFNADGGAICSQQGVLRMTNCTVWGNLAQGGRGGDNGLGAGGAGGAALGGGLFWTTAETATNWLVNCTISANQVLGGEGGFSGSIFGPPGPRGWGTGGGILLLTNRLTLCLLNTILAGNAADHALADGYSAGSLHSLGGNLVGVTNGLSGFTATDLPGANPQLSALQFNGGLIPTCALPLDSIALDHGQALGAPLFDARGVKRPQGAGIDIGAYEVGNQRILFPDLGADLTYGDAPFRLQATASSDLPVTFSVAEGPGFISPTDSSLVVITGAGSISVVASQAGSDIYLPAPSVTNSLAVKKARLAVWAEDAARAYGATNPTFSGTLSGVVNDDSITVQFVSAATNSTPAGIYGPDSTNAIRPVLLDPAGRLANYTVQPSYGTLTITQAAQSLVVTLPSTNRPYGAPNPAFQAILAHLLPWDAISAVGVTPATSASPVGQYPIVPVWNDPEGRLANYQVVTNLGTLSVSPARLSAAADNAIRAYGATNPVFSGTLSGVANDDPITVQFVSAATNSTPVGIYGPDSTDAIRPMLQDPAGRLANYTVQPSYGTLTITQAAQSLVVTLPSTNRPYGAPNPAFQATLSNLFPWDTISAVGATPATPASPVGQYPVTPVWSDAEGRLANYNVVTNLGNLSVLPTPLTVIADDRTRAYGEANPVFTGRMVGLTNNDPITLHLSSAATRSTPVGVYGPGSPNAIIPVLIDLAGRLSNYSPVVFSNGTLTITKSLQPLVVTLLSTNRPYGAPNPPFQVMLSNLFPWDAISAVGVTPATPASPVGQYPILPAWSDPNGALSKYTVVTNAGTLTVFEQPTVAILEPTNGALYFTGMDVPARARVDNFSAPLPPVLFSVTNQLATNLLTGVSTNDTDFTTMLTNIARGTYSMQAVVTNEAGLVCQSEPVSFTVVDLTGTIGPVDTTSLEVHQTGLYFQDIWITNIASLPLPAVLVEVTGLRPGVEVYNAIGTTNGASLVRFDYPTLPGQVLRLRMEYYVPDGLTPQASFALHLAPAAPVMNVSGTVEKSAFFAYPFGGGTSLLQIRTVAGATYYVQYSSDLSNWTTVQPGIRGNNNWVEWLDNGPPKTPSLPANDPAGHRFYRVLRLP